MVGLSLIMANNLKHYIKLAGMTNGQVASAKGIAPESVSRHCNGRSQMSVRDALDYSEILGCPPEALLFEQPPLTVIGNMIDGATVNLFEEDQRYQMNVHASFPKGCRLLKREWRNRSMRSYSDMFCVIDAKPMKSNTVPQAVYGKPAIVKYLYDDVWTIGYFIIFPDPDGVFTLQGVYSNELYRQVDVEWSCPILGVATRPDLLGWSEVL